MCEFEKRDACDVYLNLNQKCEKRATQKPIFIHFLFDRLDRLNSVLTNTILFFISGIFCTIHVFNIPLKKQFFFVCVNNLQIG